MKQGASAAMATLKADQPDQPALSPDRTQETVHRRVHYGPQTPLPLRYRLAVFSRVAAAIAGGYAFSALSALMLAQILQHWIGMARSEAVTTATLLFFVIYLCVILWVFATASALRAWAGLLIATAPVGAVVALFMLRSAA